MRNVTSDVHTPSGISKYLESCQQRGIDLLSVFGRYDSAGIGRITFEEFAAAISDLGLSTISSREIEEFGYKYECCVGNSILYRRFIS